MKKGVYMALAGLSETDLLYPLPDELPADPARMPNVSCAVYIAVDAHGVECYVGSVHRPGDTKGLASHIGEYMRGLAKAQKWRGIYVLPLRPCTTEQNVRRLAGNIAGWLLPYDRERWPLAV